MSDLSSNVSCAPESQRMRSLMRHIQGAHVETHFGSYLSQILMDFVSIWVILKLLKIGPKSPKSPNSVGSGSDQNPDRKAREPSPDRANNSEILPPQERTSLEMSHACAWKTCFGPPVTFVRPMLWSMYRCDRRARISDKPR